jgi:signal transduction histidine kinase
MTGAGGRRGYSVERPLWRAVAAFRVLAAGYAVLRYATDTVQHYRHPLGGWIYISLLALWTLATLRWFWFPDRRRRWRLLAIDLCIAVAGVLLTRWLDAPTYVAAGDVTLPTFWAGASVLGFSVKGGWRPAALAVLIVGIADNVERGAFSIENVHNTLEMLVAGVGIGYVIEVARASEAALARALEIEAATRERERLARDIHDSVLQVLALVQRRGTEAGGEAAEIGRMAGEQEVALRALISDGLGGADGPSEPGGEAELDLRSLLAPHASARVSVAAPGEPVVLPAPVARELAAAVAAALDNVRRHAGERASAWILVEDEPEEVVVGVRDDGPGFAPGRLGAAEREGRLGVAQSIRGRLRDLGGSAEIWSAPGQGTEVELRVPRARAAVLPEGGR